MALASSMFSLLLHLMLLPLWMFAQQTSPIKLGSTLSTNNSTWNSPSGDFALGFRQINTSSYLLAIWYANIPDTIVWYAGADGLLAPKGSVLTCTADQGLILSDPQGKGLWVTAISTSTNISNCFLNDTGNLMINLEGGTPAWQSFDDPRDTLLPTQTIKTLDSGGPKVYSRHTKNSFTRGKFQLRLLPDGNLVLNSRSLVTDFELDAYYISGTYDPNNVSNSGYIVSYEVSGHMYIVKRNGEQDDLLYGQSFPSPKDYYFKATLNYDGVFLWYYHKKDITNESSSWTVLKWIPDNICSSKKGTEDGGVCGFNSICRMNRSTIDYPRPTCECPPKYSLFDPNDAFGGCKPDFRMPAYNEVIGYRIERLPMIDWPDREYDRFVASSEEECMNSCLNDFLCVAAILSEQNCLKKAQPLIDGQIDETHIAFLKVRDGRDDGNNSQVFVLPIPNSRRNWRGMNPLASTFMGTSLFLSLLLFGAILVIWLLYCKSHKGVSPKVSNITHMKWNNIRCFSYKDLEEATDGFKQVLGRGACAIVYKGVVDGSQTLVAVKKIERALFIEAEKEFQVEVSVIGKTHHKNLVRLIGFCHEEEHRMLVYEFMTNGSLAGFLFGKTKPGWSRRVQIAQGIARGLVYLHEECESQIIHCDIKPQNILLDDHFEARISDFGLSKLLMLNQIQTRTMIRGTKGYVAPEWFKNKPVTVKVDVYSFGVVLLELISCRRCINLEPSEEERAILVEWAFDCYQIGDLNSFVDNDMEALDDKVKLEKFMKVAMWCIQEDPNLRPTMREVTLMLEDFIDVSTPPNPDQDSLSVSIVDQ